MKARRVVPIFALVLGVVLLSGASSGLAASPSSGTVDTTATSTSWTGQHYTAAATIDPTACPPAAVDSQNLVCDHFFLTVGVDPTYWDTHTGTVAIAISWADSSNDFDLYVYDSQGNEVGSSTAGGTTSEQTGIDQPSGTYEVVVVPFTVVDSGYSGAATFASQETTTSPKPSNWHVVTHGECCEGNLAASGSSTYVLLPVLLSGNKIERSDDSGQTWKRVYPPLDLSVPFGIEGDLRTFGDDVVYFGTEVTHGVAAHSDDRGEHWTVVQIPVAFPANDQAWEYLGPVSPCPVKIEPYVLAGWYRIGSVVLFSCDGGLTWPIQTPLAGLDGSGPQHVVCEDTAVPGAATGTDTRIANAKFASMKAGRHGGFGPDGRFYWSEAKDGFLYICSTGNFGATWEGFKHPLATGTPSGHVVTTLAFDDKGTLYVLHTNKLYVSFDQGRSLRFVQTLPRWGDDPSVADRAAEWFVVNGGTISIGLKEAAADGTGNIWYLQGKHVDTAHPGWKEELVDNVAPVRLDFMQIAVDGHGVPTISYTTPPNFTNGTTTATRSGR